MRRFRNLPAQTMSGLSPGNGSLLSKIPSWVYYLGAAVVVAGVGIWAYKRFFGTNVRV